MGTDIDVRLMATLASLLETRSVTRTAEALGQSQPAVSRALARAREQFQDPLLLRGGDRMVLTARAESLREPLSGWLRAGEALLRPLDVDPDSLSRRFRIASTDYGVFSVVEPSLARIAGAAPGLEMAIVPFTPESGRELVVGEIDLLISGVEPDPSQVHSTKLFEEMQVCVAAADHPDLIDGAMTPEAFFAAPHVVVRIPNGTAADYEGEHASVQRRQLVVSDNFMMTPYLLMGTNVVATLPSRAASRFAQEHGLATFDPPAPLPSFGYWLSWHERAHRDPEVRWLIRELARPFQAGDKRGRAAA